jgi:nucleoside-diphosphate-sugar epimerase
MDALVLGGTRFIGLRLVQLLHRQGHAVTVLNRGTRKTALPDGVASITADREVPSEVAAALRGKSFDAAFDTSAYVPETLGPAVEALDGNVGSYVFCSTTAVYQRSDRYPIKSDFPLDRAPDASGYTKGKVDCEDLLREAHARNGFPATILRPPAIYGPHNALPEREFSYFARALQRRTIIIPGEPSALVQFAHVDDLAAAFLAAASTDRGVGKGYTVCGEYAVNVDYWIHTVGSVVDSPVDVVYVAGSRFSQLNRELGLADTDIWPFGWGRAFVFSIDEARRDLAWSPRFDIESGLEMTYRWWLDQGLDKEEWDFAKDDKMLARLAER